MCHIQGNPPQSRVHAGRWRLELAAVKLVPLRTWWIARKAERKGGGEDVHCQSKEEEVAEPAPHLGRSVGQAADKEGQRRLDQSNRDVKNQFVQGAVVIENLVIFVGMLPLPLHQMNKPRSGA